MNQITEKVNTSEAEALADAVLRAAGSGLQHYSMPKTREAILTAAQNGLDDARAEPVKALQFTREWFTENGLEESHYAICSHLDEAIAEAKGLAA